MEPKQAVDEYAEVKKHSSADATIQNYRYRLERFVEFCEEAGIQKIEAVTSRTAELFKRERLENPEINPYTLEQQMRTFRQFLRWCESNELIEDGVAEKLIIPNSAAPDRVRNEAVGAEKANRIIENLVKYKYASVHHIIFHTLWDTGIRMGSLRALDVDDWDRENEFLKVRHRPHSDTPLKQKRDGERNITVTDERLVEALNDWIEDIHPKVEDDYGRMPLIGTQSGRAHKSTVRSKVYFSAQPCRYSSECPHDREISECEARNHDHFSKCPSSVYPYTIRSGAVTAHLNEDIPKEIVSERANMSEGVLDKHYDERTEEQKRERREKYL